ncbi:hypothetical protein KM043_011758 [Ampulex compressa]|nr:hypothetical protein KM043_011758 [Ampulex compressa]
MTPEYLRKPASRSRDPKYTNRTRLTRRKEPRSPSGHPRNGQREAHDGTLGPQLRKRRAECGKVDYLRILDSRGWTTRVARNRHLSWTTIVAIHLAERKECEFDMHIELNEQRLDSVSTIV